MIEKFDVHITPFHLDRRIHLYLPKNYHQSEKRYPVLYMYDGHNLYYDSDATYGKSWGMKDYLDKSNYEMIVVGIECNHEGNKRLEEFSPYSGITTFAGEIEGKGEIFMDWVVDELKPFIDQNYRTLPDRTNTAIGGSSMGGLMSLFSVIHYNHIFSKAACLSSAISFCMDELYDEIQRATLNSDTKIYMDFGSLEARDQKGLAYLTSNNLEIAHALSLKGVSTYPRVIVDGIHNEATWEKQIPIFMDYFFYK